MERERERERERETRRIIFKHLTLILLTWKIRRAPNNASRWQMGINSAFIRLNKGLPKRRTVSHYLHILKSATCFEECRHFRRVRQSATKTLLISSYLSVRTSSQKNPPLPEMNFAKFYIKDFIKIHRYNWISVTI